MKQWDVVVVGGGLSGLLAANLLAQAGKSVAVLEKAEQFGGRARTANKNGVLLNMGGHAVYKDGELLASLRKLGIQPQGGTPSTRGYGIWKKMLYPLPGSPLSLLSFPLLSWKGKMELGQLMMKLTRWQSQPKSKVSLREWAEQSIQDPMVRHLFYALVRTGTYAHMPELQLAQPALLQMQRALKGGVLYVDGGWASIVEQLRSKAAQAGVAMLSGRQAQAVQLDADGRACGVRCADGDIAASAVLVAMPLAEACKLVPGGERTAIGAWSRQAVPITAACLDIGLRRLPQPKRQFVLGLDQPIFFSNHSRAAKLSDDETQVVHIIKYHSRGPSDAAADEQELERALDLIQPGWRSEVVARQFLPRITVVPDFPHTERLALPQPAVPEIPDLYVAGDWAGGEMLADASAASAERAAAQIAQTLSAKQHILI